MIINSQKDYYRGGMAINFGSNSLSNMSFMQVSRLISAFRGLRSINLSHLRHFKFVPTFLKKGEKGDKSTIIDKNDQIMLFFANSLARNTSITHLDISGIEFSARVVDDMLRAIQHNSTLQEMKLSVYSNAKNRLPQQPKTLKTYFKYHLSSQFNYYVVNDY